LVTLLIERSHLVTLLRRLRLRKIDFGTFQLGIAQLVPRVLGSPSPSPPPKLAKKKNSKKKFRTHPPPLPLLIGNRRERSEKISKRLKSFPKSPKEFRQATKPLGDPELSSGPRSSRSLKRALIRLTPTKPAPCTKGQPIKTDLTAPLLTLANYLYTYIIRLLPHSSAPGYFVSLSPIRLNCPGVNMNSNPNPLLRGLAKRDKSLWLGQQIGPWLFCEPQLREEGPLRLSKVAL
jgi:hypothetical protein